MISIKKVIVFCTLSFPLLTFANNDSADCDSLQNQSFKTQFKSFIIPASLMLYGTIETVIAPKYRMLNYAIGHVVITHKPTRFTIDDVLHSMFLPQVYIC